jgi:formiminoglutamase
MSLWRPTDPQLFFSRQDQDDPRLGDLVRPFTPGAALGPRAFVIGGYPDDEGIRLNGGRLGAATAPVAIRRPLYKMTPALQETLDFTLYDHGDLDVTSIALADRHAAGASACASVLAAGGRWSAWAEDTITASPRPLVF